MRILIRLVEGWLNQLFNFITLRANNVRYGENLSIRGRIYIRNRGRLVIGDNVTINSGERQSPVGGQSRTRLITGADGEIIIGNGSGLSNTTIFSASKISLGENSLIGGSCNIWDTDFHSMDPVKRQQKEDVGRTVPVRIGRNVFVGAHCIILKGSDIPDNGVVPAGTVGCIRYEETLMPR